MNNSYPSLRSNILIAMPSLNDPNFNRAITLICDYSQEHGAMGIILNQPTNMTIHELLNISVAGNVDESLNDLKIHTGGPIDRDHGFILHDSDYQYDATIKVADHLYLTSSTTILEDIARGAGPQNKLIVLGYAGWAPGQLEREISDNSWLTTVFEHQLVFSTPAEQQWLYAGKLLGIDLNLLSVQPGHA